LEIDFAKLPRFKHHAMTILSLVPEWAHAHQVPEDAIRSQIYTAHAWCNSNAKKAPKKNVVRFLWSWMASAKRYGNLKTPQAPASPRPPDPEGDMTVEEMRAIRRQNMPQYRGDPQKFPGAIETEAIKDVA
jgi:hypothetical protein